MLKRRSLRVTVENIGRRSGETVLQVYRKIENPLAERNGRLVGFQRVALKKGERKCVKVPLSPDWLRLVGEDGEAADWSGLMTLTVSDGGNAEPFVLHCMVADGEEGEKE